MGATSKQNVLEWQLQASIIDWSNYHPIIAGLIIMIPNEGKRNIGYAYRLRKMGLKRGVSDLFLAYPCHGKAGLWLEMKSKGNKPNPIQAKWLELMRKMGYASNWADSFEDAISIIENYLKGVVNEPRSCE